VRDSCKEHQSGPCNHITGGKSKEGNPYTCPDPAYFHHPILLTNCSPSQQNNALLQSFHHHHHQSVYPYDLYCKPTSFSSYINLPQTLFILRETIGDSVHYDGNDNNNISLTNEKAGNNSTQNNGII
jgi:hypothetical protein